MIYEKKCVIVIDKNLPLGVIANTSAILGCTLGKSIPSIVGSDVNDKDNFMHKGVINIPLPILSSTKEEIKKLYEKVNEKHDDNIKLIDFNSVAQKCKDYNDYIEKLSCFKASELSYLGICMYGNKKAINSLTGSIPTLK